MTIKGGLKLKREVAAATPMAPSSQLPIAQVWVDASVYHLDSPFSYLVPQNLNDAVVVGSLVSIPFHGREIQGLVLARSESSGESGMKSISKVLGNIPLLSQEIIQLIATLAKRYAAHPFDLIRSAVPDRMATIEKEFVLEARALSDRKSSKMATYLQLPPAQNRSALIARKIAEFEKSGGVIALLPDAREVIALSVELDKLELKYAILESSLPKSEYFRNFMRIRTGQVRIVIGTRSAVFAPVVGLQSIVIYNDGSENYYEQRSPGWNARDVALERSQLEGIHLTLIGYSPSAEIGRAIDEGSVIYKRSRGKLKVSSIAQIHGELLPSRALAPLKGALTEGAVLFIVPLKGYAQAIRCAKCKTISRCECGGAHQKTSTDSLITCSHCAASITSWRCSWCHESQPALASRGIERHIQELGLLFPGIPGIIATADHPVIYSPPKGIVVATPHMAPLNESGYSAVVVLEGNRFLNQPDMRGQERAREMFFSHAALAREGAPIILVQDDGDSISTALTTWNPSIALERELTERQQLGLPPYVRSAILTMKSDEGIRLKKALESARDENRLPKATKILGPIPEGENVSLILTVPLASGDELISTIHEFMRRRSASKKTLPSLRIDPYSLSR